MPNIKSAKKRVLIAAKKNEQNRAFKTRMNHAIKKFNHAIETNDIEGAEKLLPETMSIIDVTASKGVIHKNQAANKKSMIAKRLSDVKSGKISIEIKKDNKTIAAEKAKKAQELRAAQKAEFQARAAEKKAAKLAAEQARLEEEEKAKKAKKKEKPAKAEKAEKAEKEEKPKAKRTKKEKTEEAPAEEAKSEEAKAESPEEPKEAPAEDKAE